MRNYIKFNEIYSYCKDYNHYFLFHSFSLKNSSDILLWVAWKKNPKGKIYWTLLTPDIQEMKDCDWDNAVIVEKFLNTIENDNSPFLTNKEYSESMFSYSEVKTLFNKIRRKEKINKLLKD